MRTLKSKIGLLGTLSSALGATFVLLVLHRLLVLRALGFPALGSLGARLMALGAGFLSDFWVSCLFVSCLLLALLPFGLRIFVAKFRVCFLVVYVFLILLLAAHVPYVDFFHVTFRRVHLAYFWDFEFASSAAWGLFQWRVAMQSIVGCVLAVLFAKVTGIVAEPRALGASEIFGTKKHPAQQSLFSQFLFTQYLTSQYRLQQLAALSSLLILGVYSNYLANKTMRTQNLNERVVLNTLVSFGLDAIAHAERTEFLRNGEEALAWIKKSSGTEILKNIASEDTSLGELLRDLQESFSAGKLAAQPRYFFVVLMESARAIDSRLLTPSNPGHTPFLDNELANNGIAFLNGYGTGTVSRGGAESTSCNSLASLHYNAMRNTPLAAPVCAAEIFTKPLQAQGIDSWFAWAHGGYHGFDGQGDFWNKNNFEIPIDILHLDEKLPRSGWGVSDIVFFQEVANWLQRPEAMKPGLHFASIVNISNHSAWVLPEDTPPDLLKQVAKHQNKNFQTLRYADYALQGFFQTLRKMGIWENSVLVLVGDHGMEEPTGLPGDAYGFGSGVAQDVLSAEKLSRVYFGLAGGLVQKARRKCEAVGSCPGNSLVVQKTVSQADILPTLAHLLKVPNLAFFGVSLFSNKRFFPVISDLGDHIYLPSQKKVATAKEFLNSQLTFVEETRENELEEEEMRAKAFYRSYLYATQIENYADNWRAALYSR